MSAIKGMTLDQLRQRYLLREASAPVASGPPKKAPEERAQAAIATRVLEGKCPSCGAALSSSTRDVSISCLQCSFPLREGHIPSVDEVQAHRAAREADKAQRVRQVNTAKLAASKMPPTGRARWALAKDIDGNDDAILQFGKYAGRTVSELAAQHDGHTYLTWMQTQDFPAELMEIVSEQLGARPQR